MTLQQLKWTIIDRPGDHDHVARWHGRCTYCGHRVGPNVIETRRQPWRIPSEIVGRYCAMNATVVEVQATQAEKREQWTAYWDAMIDDEENIEPEETA